MIQFDNLVGELALKAIAWDQASGKFVSPSRKEFTWGNDGLESATCEIPWEDAINPVTKEVEHYGAMGAPYDWLITGRGPCKDEDIPGDNCTCGLYATFRWNIIGKGYTKQTAINPVVLVETVGKTILYTDGMRSYQQAIRAVIDVTSIGTDLYTTAYMASVIKNGPVTLIPQMRASVSQAADYFNVPVVKYAAATFAMDIWNISLNKIWTLDAPTDSEDFYYRPESEAISNMTEEQLNNIILQYLPQRKKEPITWQQLLEST